MAERHSLHRQQTSISLQFDPSSPQYFCCFGLCHAKTIGVLLFFCEIVVLISSAAFLLLRSGSYTTKEWQDPDVLILVAISLIYLVILGVTTSLLFMGVCYEEGSLIAPYIISKIMYVMGILAACWLKPDRICLALSFAVFQVVLFFLALGTYRYLSDLKTFHQYKPPPPASTDSSTAYSSSLSRISYRYKQPKSRLSIEKARPATIDLC